MEPHELTIRRGPKVRRVWVFPRKDGSYLLRGPEGAQWVVEKSRRGPTFGYFVTHGPATGLNGVRFVERDGRLAVAEPERLSVAEPLCHYGSGQGQNCQHKGWWKLPGVRGAYCLQHATIRLGYDPRTEETP